MIPNKRIGGLVKEHHLYINFRPVAKVNMHMGYITMDF